MLRYLNCRTCQHNDKENMICKKTKKKLEAGLTFANCKYGKKPSKEQIEALQSLNKAI